MRPATAQPSRAITDAHLRAAPDLPLRSAKSVPMRSAQSVPMRSAHMVQPLASPQPSSQSSAHAPVDAEIAALFAQLRIYLRLPAGEVAIRLGTDPRVIAALEAGRVDLLPHWPETHRIVTAYAASAGIDARAVVDRLALQFDRLARPRPSALPAPEEAPEAAVGKIVHRLARQPDDEPEPWRLFSRLSDLGNQVSARAAALRESATACLSDLRARKHPVRWVLAAAVAVVLAVSVAPSGMLQASVGGLSSPITGLLRGISDQLTLASAPVRDGHRWIEVDDPRQRRSDKLRSPGS